MNQTTALAEPFVDDDSIDLRRYVLALLRYWWLILGLGVVGSLLAFTLSARAPVTYEATATVLIAKPRHQVTLDPRIRTTADATAVSAKALVTLASSDEVLSEVATSAGASAESIPEAASLRGRLSAAEGSDPTLVLLKARASAPGQAATLANAWASALAERARFVHGGAQDVAYFGARLVEAEASLAKAESDLAEHQAKSTLGTLKARLSALQEDQQISLAEKARANRLLDEIDVLREQVSRSPSGDEVPAVGNQVVALLEARALGIESPLVVSHTADASTPGRTEAEDSGAGVRATVSTNTTAPITLVTGTSDATRAWKAGELLKLLDDLSTVLEGKARAADARASAAQPQLLDLQRQVQQSQAQTDRATLERDVARESYLAIARKVEESRITAAGEGDQFSVASQAMAPGAPVGQNASRNVAMAGLLGAIAGAILALVIDWWRQGRRSPAPNSLDEPLPASA